ncbi:MAG TPA: amidohydrolase [Candidatus Polarisedimenticolaceae bacterium]|nr:amidohydrolase [Candidatus Polarisedimenticolaceae bacterium]
MADDRLRTEADRIAPELVVWRRRLHQQPELGFEEHETSRFVAERLAQLGVEVRTGLAGTGVAGILRSPRRDRPGVLLRADMDALPVQEVDGREYGSRVPGRMHACGHDGHTAMLLGAAKLLEARKSELRRDVVFCFQPAEEGLGGAERMIDDGVLELVETGSVFGLHLWSGAEVGTAMMRAGPAMAAQDEIEVRILGRGGHGALPHTARDPIVAASLAVVALQGIVARNVDPVETAVVTVGSLHAGTAPNVIPAEARLAGTLRSFSEEVRELLRLRSREVIESSAIAAGCTADYLLKKGFPAVVNDAASVEIARRLAVDVFGEGNVVEHPPIAAAEDFSYFLGRRPGAFIFVGAANTARGIDAPHHSPMFDIDEAALPRGAELLARLALD